MSKELEALANVRSGIKSGCNASLWGDLDVIEQALEKKQMLVYPKEEK